MRVSPAVSRPTLPFFGTWVLALAFAATTAAQAPPAKKAAAPPAKKAAAPPAKKAAAPPADTSPLVRYVPKEDLAFYFEFSGLEGHAVAWQKTAAYRMLNETPLGLMLEDLGTQLADKALALRPGRLLSGAEIVAIVKHMARSGFAVGICHGPQKPDDAVAMMVIRGATRRETRGTFGRLMGTLAGAASKPQIVKMGGERSVVSVPGATPKQSWAWWSEKNDLVVAAQPTSGKDRRGAEQIIEVLDGKRPGAVGHPIYLELVKAKGPFQPVGLGFLVPIELPPDAASLKTTLDGLGLRGIQRIEYQWGLEGDALSSVTRVVAPRPRRGLLSLYDQPTFEKGALPPLPKGITGFRVVSLDLAKSLDALLAVTRSLGGSVEPLANNLLSLFKERTRLDLSKDVLAHLGPKMAFYVSEAKDEPAVSEGVDAGGGLGGLAGGVNLKAIMAAAVAVPKFTLVAEVKDAAAVGRALDELMVEANKGLREWRFNEQNREAEAREAGAAGARSKKSAQPPRPRPRPTAPAFRSTGTDDMKSYVLNMPQDMPRLPAGLRPTIRLGAKHIVVSVSSEAAKQALEEKEGKWAPSPDLVPVFERLPTPLVSLSITDPRPTLPATLASLPATLQKVINTAILQAQAGRKAATTPTTGGGAPGPSLPSGPPGESRRDREELPGVAAPFGAGPEATLEPAIITLEVDPARMPSPDALKALLFPGSSAVSVDDQAIQFSRRGAFPEIGLTTPAILVALTLPAVQAARDAAARARAPSTAPAPAPGPSAPPRGAPATTPPRRPIVPG